MLNHQLDTLHPPSHYNFSWFRSDILLCFPATVLLTKISSGHISRYLKKEAAREKTQNITLIRAYHNCFFFFLFLKRESFWGDTLTRGPLKLTPGTNKAEWNDCRAASDWKLRRNRAAAMASQRETSMNVWRPYTQDFGDILNPEFAFSEWSRRRYRWEYMHFRIVPRMRTAMSYMLDSKAEKARDHL